MENGLFVNRNTPVTSDLAKPLSVIFHYCSEKDFENRDDEDKKTVYYAILEEIFDSFLLEVRIKYYYYKDDSYFDLWSELYAYMKVHVDIMGWCEDGGNPNLKFCYLKVSYKICILYLNLPHVLKKYICNVIMETEFQFSSDGLLG